VYLLHVLLHFYTQLPVCVRALIPHTSWARLYDHDSPTSTPQPLSPPLSSVLFLSLRRESAAGYGTALPRPRPSTRPTCTAREYVQGWTTSSPLLFRTSATLDPDP
jgi:hypothetical protein